MKEAFPGRIIFTSRQVRRTKHEISKGNSAMALGVIPPAHAFFLGKIFLSSKRTENPACPKRYPAVVPAGPAPVIMTSYMPDVYQIFKKGPNLFTTLFHKDDLNAANSNF